LEKGRMFDIATTMTNASTVIPDYVEAYTRISELNFHLNVFEKAWAAWYEYMQNDVLATGIMSFVMHEMVYFGRSLPWIIIDQISYFRKWKIQNTKIPTAAEQWRCTCLVLLSHFTVELPQIWLFHPMCKYFGMSTDVPFPAWNTIAYQVAIFFVLEDTWHYWFHRLFHWGFFLQIYPQDSPYILGSVWSCGRIRFPHRGYDAWVRDGWDTHPMVRCHRESSHSHNVHLDYLEAFPGDRCPLRLRLSLVSP